MIKFSRGVHTFRIILFVFLAVSCLRYGILPWFFQDSRQTPKTIIFFGFSIASEVMQQGIFPAFTKYWLKEHNEQIEFSSSFAGSGTVVNQIILGVHVQVALLALQPDVDKLIKANLVDIKFQESLPYHGIVNRSPFVILVRKGNPLGIKSFADLSKPGISLIHPDPLISGAALWTLVAEYCSVLQAGGSAEDAQETTLKIWSNISAQAASARAARTQFDTGFGDALVTYEQDALRPTEGNIPILDIVYPQRTIESEHPLVVVPKNITLQERPIIDAFVSYLFQDEAQQIFARYGFRSVNKSINGNQFEALQDVFDINECGGWKELKALLIEKLWKNARQSAH